MGRLSTMWQSTMQTRQSYRKWRLASNFSHTNVEYLKLWGSDHRPILARIKSNNRKVQCSFKFDRRWLGKEGLKETIQSSWTDTDIPNLQPLHSKIANCRKALSVWKRENQTNSAKTIEEVKYLLEQAQTEDTATSDEILDLKWKLCAAFRDEELYWRQKSRITWLVKRRRP